MIRLEAALAIAVLKYRLYDIDIVISKALQYGALAAFITAVYAALVVGVGAAAGDQHTPLGPACGIWPTGSPPSAAAWKSPQLPARARP